MSWAVETLAATSILMALVLLVRRPIARAFGARAAYALWLAPLARAVLPPIPLELPAAIVLLDLTAAGGSASAAQSAGIGMAAVLVAVWLGGALLFLAWHAVVYRHFIARAVDQGRPIATPDIKDSAVIATPAVTGPAATGLIVRRIFVPADFERAFSPEERMLALAHEALHHRRGDLWASAGALALLALHWFNPIAHAAHRAFRRDLEAACDASLLDTCGADVRPAYARTILRCAGQAMPQTSCALTPIGELKGRLEMLNLHHGKGRRLAGTAIAASLAGASLLLAQPVAAQDKPDGPATERVEVRRFVMDGKDGPDNVRRALPGEFRERMANCDGEKFEAESGAPGTDGKKHTRMFICAKAGSSKAETAAALEKVLSRLEGDSEMPAGNKAQIVARLKARIAELKAGG